MRFRKTAAAIVAMTAVGLGAAACSDDVDDSAGADGTFSSVEAPADVAAPQRASESDAAGSAARPGVAPPEPGKASPAPFQAVNVADRKVVRTASMSVEVDDLQRAAAAVRAMAGTAGGFVGYESSGDDFAQLTLRVAADRFDRTLDDVAALGKVERRDLNTEDVTGQTVDLTARINSQRASVARVQALLDRATTIGEIVQVESELTSRQAELESMEQQAAALGDQVALATVNVELFTTGQEPSKTEDDDESGFTGGLSDGWDAFGDLTKGVLTVVGAVLPFAGAAAVIAAIVLVGIRSRRRSTPAPAGPTSAGPGEPTG